MSGKVFAGMARLGAVALVILAASGAQAAKYTGTWDPAYGEPFPNVGWRGEAVVEIPDACVPTAALKLDDCSEMRLLSARVDFYELGPGNPLIESMSWGSVIPLDLPLLYAYFDGAELVSIRTSYLTPDSPDASFDSLNNYDFYLRFLQSGARLTHVLKTSGEDFETCPQDEPVPAICGYSGGSRDGVAFTRFTRVPEPGTYALLLVGLLAAGLVTRRRSH